MTDKRVSQEKIDDVLGYIDAAEIARMVEEIVDIPSPTGAEAPLALYLAGMFSDIGLRSRLQEVEPNRSNVIGILEGTGGGPSLMLNGHLDTTWTGQEEGIRELGAAYQPKSYRENGWIYGMGAYNMKSAFSAFSAAARAIKKAGIALAGDLVIGGTVGETERTPVEGYEGPQYRGFGVGSNFLVTHGFATDAAIVGEPTAFHAGIATCGAVQARIRIRGFPGATYLRGKAKEQRFPDPIEKMVGIIPALKEWGEEWQNSHTIEGEPATSVYITAIEGGLPYRTSKQPPACNLYMEIRTLPEEPVLNANESLKELLNELRSKDPELNVTMETNLTYPGALIDQNEPIVRALTSAHHSILDTDPVITFEGWTSDAIALTRYGIKTITYGGGGYTRVKESAKEFAGYVPDLGEHVFVEDLVRAAKVYALTALDFCSRKRRDVVSFNQ